MYPFIVMESNSHLVPGTKMGVVPNFWHIPGKKIVSVPISGVNIVLSPQIQVSRTYELVSRLGTLPW